MSELLVKIYITLILPAFIFSLVAFGKKYPKYLRIFAIILGSDLILEIWANYLPKPFQLQVNGLYNVAMLIEFWGYAFFYRYMLRNKIIRKVVRLYLFIFPLIWILLVCVQSGFNTWNSYISVVGSIAMILLSACMYYQLFTTNPLVKLTGSFEFWVATGLIIFFACNFTYLGMLNFLNGSYRPLAHQLLIILQVSNSVFYCIISYAFICLYRNNVKQISKELSVKSKTFMTDPNNYGQTIDFNEIKGRMTIDNSPDIVLGQTGYLNLVRNFFPTMQTHIDTQTLVKNILDLLANVNNTDGCVAIVGHGASGIIGAGIGNSLAVGPCLDKCISVNNEPQWTQLFEKLKNKGIKNLYLFSCATGAGNKGAQLLHDLAKSIGAIVAAPTGRILIFQNGRFFKLEENATWQVADPSLPRPAAIEMPPITIPAFTQMRIIHDVQPNLEIMRSQITAIGIGKPAQLDKWTALPSSQFEELLDSINFIDPEDLKGGVMAGFITGALTVRFNCPANNGSTEEQEDREFIIFNNRYVQDCKFRNIVYHCKDSIGKFFL